MCNIELLKHTIVSVHFKYKMKHVFVCNCVTQSDFASLPDTYYFFNIIMTLYTTSGYPVVSCKHLYICEFVSGKQAEGASHETSSEGENHCVGRGAD